MKTVRLDFSGGVNVITDKSVLPDKFASVIDNVDLRSGFPRCVKEPIFYRAVAESNTKQIFSYRGRWIYSDKPRDYATEFINGSERIYFTEDGAIPKKMVEGVEVPLGTPRPTSQPLVSSANNIVPIIDEIELIDGGSLAAGSYYYAVSAEFPNGITAPSNIASKTFTGDNEKNVKITWTAVSGAIAYVVFGRANGYENMQRMVRVDASVNTFIDDGALTPSQDRASQYFDDNQVSYVYTYERLVVNMYDESGLSPVSEAIRTNSGRNVTRDFLNDGFLNQPSSKYITDTDGYQFQAIPNPSTSTFPYYPQVNIISFVFDRYLKQVLFECYEDHNLSTGDEIKFSGSSWTDASYKDRKFNVIVTSPKTFAIKDIPAPTDSISGFLEPDSLVLQNPVDNYRNNINQTFSLSGGFGANATVNIVTGSLVNGASSITSWALNNFGNGYYRVGDILKAAIPNVINGVPTSQITGISSFTSGTLYPTDGVPASIAIDGMAAGSGYTDGAFIGEESVGISATGTQLRFSGNVVSGSVSASGLVPYPFSPGAGYTIGDTFTFQNPPGGGSGFVGKVVTLQPKTYTNVPLVAAPSGTASGTGATANVTVNGNGTIFAVSIVNGGSGYLATDLLTFDSSVLPTSGTKYTFTPTVQSQTTDAVFRVISVFDDYTISVGRARISITPSLNDLNDGDAIYLSMKDSGSGGVGRVAINYEGSGYNVSTITKFENIPLIYVSGFSGNGTGATADLQIQNGTVIDFVISEDGVGYEIGDKLTINPALINSTNPITSSPFLATVLFINGPSEIVGLYKVYKNDIYGNPIPNGQFDINTVVDDWDGPTQLGAFARWTPRNGYYKTWNVYRTGAAGAFQLVERVDVYNSNYLDTTSAEYLGSEPTSYYTDTGIFGQLQIDFMTPPVDLFGVVSHYGMLFGISGQTVKWTPINAPDAWPDNYYIPFSYRPLALASFGTGLIVLCEDAIYRIDGNQPSSMSLSKTMAEDGCIAPYSVQLTTHGLVYVSKRGVMLFDGMNATCITDTKIPPRLLLGPSKMESPYNFWWLTTKQSYFYGNFANKDNIWFIEPSGNKYFLTNQIPTPNYDIKSFYQYGKYYVVFTGTDTYGAHSTLCIDLMAEGMPITTLGLKPIDVFVDEFEDAYVLVNNQGNGNNENLETFKLAQSSIDQNTTYASNSGLSIWKLFSGKSNMPLFIRSGQKGFGNTTERRRYEQVEFYGNGRFAIRVYIDGRHIADDIVTLTEAPSRPRRLNMPRGNRMGYVVDMEVAGDTDRIIFEYAFSDLPRPS